jgi:hypothetical protein
MPAAINQMRTAAPVLATSLAGCAWWEIGVAAILTVFLHGADPAMKWLDVIDRLRARRARGDDSRR